MTKGVFAALVLFWATLLVVAGEARGTGNARAGRETVETICAPCDVVAGDQKQAPLMAPPAQSFVEIARGPKTDEWTLQTFLASAHNSISHAGKMPNPQLSKEQFLDVTAYILSLGEQRKRRD